jgi:hypothetical protein
MYFASKEEACAENPNAPFENYILDSVQKELSDLQRVLKHLSPDVINALWERAAEA